MNTRIHAYYFTHPGSIRTENEDSLLIQDILINHTSMDAPTLSEWVCEESRFIVADGIGGEAKGEVASNLVLASIRDTPADLTGESGIRDLLTGAKERLEEYVAEHPDAHNLGCTLAGVFLTKEGGIAFNAGDCRVYRINGTFFEQMTRDHSLVQTLLDAGAITEEEMRHHPRRNVVTSSVSGDGNPDPVEVFTTAFRLRSDDTFFICCDGIWGSFSHDELEMIYQRFPGPDFCGKIQTAALARGASDNISAILVMTSQVE